MTEIADVVVIGYGFAGANAAIAAADAGASVLLLERMAAPGGISICSAGGIRIAKDAAAALAYLEATCAGKTPTPVLAALARGMTEVGARVRAMAGLCGAAISERPSPGNYPLPGGETFGFVYVESIPGFDPASAYPDVRGSPAGALLFKLVEANVAARTIELRMGVRAQRLLREGGRVTGVLVATGSGTKRIEARRGVVLACGGFEADAGMQEQYWEGGAALNAAFPGNTGDGIRMAQAVGADLWHMWHYHGSYGFRWPDAGYPFGVRVKRLPDWTPGTGRDVPVMPWIIVDQDGRRFMNEYEPYLQDTGARPLGVTDPTRQSRPREPAWLITDASGFAMYPFGRPTSHAPGVAVDWGTGNERARAIGLFREAGDLDGLAQALRLPAQALTATIQAWNAACGRGVDDVFARPPPSLHAITAPPFFAAPVCKVVSNTQGGPVHDAEQRVLDPFGAPIPGLFAAGELGSVFGHLYLSGGNIAECFIGGAIAGIQAARSGS